MNKELLDLILAQLAEDFPDTAKTYSAEVFADWLTNLSKQYMEAFNTPQRNSTITAELRQRGLSPTGRRPSQPELQSLPAAPFKYGDFLDFGQPLVPLTDTEIEVVKARAKELLQQYRETLADTAHPGVFRNFPCVAIDLASGSDYSFKQHPIRANHASVDDKGNVSVSVLGSWPKWKTAMDKTPRHIGKDPLLAAPYGNRYPSWVHLTPDDIYKDISGMLLRRQADEEYNRRAVENGLKQEWVHLLNGRVSSYVPADQAGDAVFSTGRFEDGYMFVETMDKGEKAVTLARAYLLRLVNLELKS